MVKNNYFNDVDDILKFDDDNITLSFSTVRGGASTGSFTSLNLGMHVGDDQKLVLENRKRYAKMLGTTLDAMVFCNQTHSANFKLVTKNDCGRGATDFSDGINDTDALYTFDSGVYLNAYYADCTPVYFYSHVNNLIGVIHAGWQGTVKQITKQTLKHVIDEYGISPDNLHVLIGPSIEFENFDVKQDVIDLVKHMDNYDGCIRHISDDQYKLDVKRLNYLQAYDLGIKNISISSLDTYDDELFFSYRKDNKAGRMCATIVRHDV